MIFSIWKRNIADPLFWMQLKNCRPKSAPALWMVCSGTVELSHLFEKWPWDEGQLRNWLEKKLRVNLINTEIKSPYQHVKIYGICPQSATFSSSSGWFLLNLVLCCKWKLRIYWTVLSKLPSARPCVPKPRPPLAWSNRHGSQQYLPWHAWI